jgi:hypothetical protein
MSALPSQSPYADASPSNLLQAIEALAADAPEDGFSLSEIMTRLDERAFGTFLFILALPVCVPFLYGVPQIVAVPMLALAFQMVIGRATPWLPAKFAQRKLSKAMLTRMAQGGRKWFGWLERITRPRLTFLATKTAERVVGVFFLIFCTSILIPLPATNTVPGIGVAIAAFGLMARDGIVVLLGLLIGSVWVSLLVLAPFIGLSFITEKMFPKPEGGGA